MDASTDAAVGTSLTAVTMGIDRFQRTGNLGNGPLDGEGLVPIYIGADLVAARDYGSWGEVFADLDALAALPALQAPDSRGVYLRAMVLSIRTAARLFSGEIMSYAEKVRDLVGAEPAPVAEARIAELTDQLDHALTAAGHGRGDLRTRVTAWEADRVVPPDQLDVVFRELMTLAKQRTTDMIFDTGDYDMQLNLLRDVPFTARCGFVDRQMHLNADHAFTRAALKHLVAHEVYPGHATQLLYTRAEVDAGRSPADALLCTTNGVVGCVQEGIGDQGVELIDWIEDRDDEIHAALRALKSAVQTTAAWRLMEEGRPVADVAEYMRTVGFGQEAWVQGRLRMASHPFRGPFVPSYFAGNECVRRVREATSAADRGAFHRYLFGRNHSPESLEMFSPAEVVA
jgi:hypothetical protein